jgi:hypothetical protein
LRLDDSSSQGAFILLNRIIVMNYKDSEQVLLAIIEQAKAEPSKFRFIVSLADYRYCLNLYRSTKLVLRILKTASKNLFKAYCKDVTSGISDFTQLVAYEELADIISFYEIELQTIYNMLDEYEEYLWSGNLFYALMGGERF